MFYSKEVFIDCLCHWNLKSGNIAKHSDIFPGTLGIPILYQHWGTLHSGTGSHSFFMLGTWSNLWKRIELRFFLLAQLTC